MGSRKAWWPARGPCKQGGGMTGPATLKARRVEAERGATAHKMNR